MSRARSSFPLAGASRRRRLLLSQSQHGAPPTDATPDDTAAASQPVRLPLPDTVPTFGTIKRLLERQEPLTWVFAGDSLTAAAPQAERGRSFGEHFAERVRWELRRLQDVVIQTGVPGERVEDLLQRLNWRALRFQPDVVSLLVGPGDAEAGVDAEAFRAALVEVVRHVRNDGAVLLLHTPPRVPESIKRLFGMLRGSVRAIRDVAREYQIPCVDHWAHWKESHGDEDSVRAWLTPDGTQPNERGHREIARLTFRKLGIFDERSATCAVNLPAR